MKDLVLSSVILVLAGLAITGVTSAGDTDSVAGSVLVANISVSLDQSSFGYGTVNNNTASSTLQLWGGAGITATNDGNMTEDFDIYGANTTSAGGTWTLAGTTGSDQYIHKFCNDTDNDCTSPPTSYTALTGSPQTFKNSISTSGTATFQLQITTPNPDTTAIQQNASVTVQASAS